MIRRVLHSFKLEGDMLIRLAFYNGNAGTVDFKPISERGGMFSRLADPQFFRKAQVSDDGRILAWPGELEFCADALYEQAVAREAS